MNLENKATQAHVGVSPELLAEIALDTGCMQLKATDGKSLHTALSSEGIAALTPAVIGSIFKHGGTLVIEKFEKFLRENTSPEVVTCIGRRIAELAEQPQINPATLLEAGSLAQVYLRPLRNLDTLEKLGAPVQAITKLAVEREKLVPEPLKSPDALDIAGFAAGARTGAKTYETMGQRLDLLATHGHGIELVAPLAAVLATKIAPWEIKSGDFDALIKKLANVVRVERRLGDNQALMNGLDNGIVSALTEIANQEISKAIGKADMPQIHKCRDHLIDFALAGSAAAATGCDRVNGGNQLFGRIHELYRVCKDQTVDDQSSPSPQKPRIRSGEFRALGRAIGNLVEAEANQQFKGATKLLGLICCEDSLRPIRAEIFELSDHPGIRSIVDAVRYFENPKSYLDPIQRWVLDETTGAPPLQLKDVQRQRAILERKGVLSIGASPRIQAAIVEAAGSALKLGERGAKAASELLRLMGLVVQTEDSRLLATVGPQNREARIKVVAEALYSGRIVPNSGWDKKARTQDEADRRRLAQGIRTFLGNDPAAQEILNSAKAAAQARLDSDQLETEVTILDLTLNPTLLQRMLGKY